MTAALSGLALVSGAVHIWADYRGPRALTYVCKPLTTGLILLIAAIAPQPASEGYRTLVVLGLAFSLAGDVFLMLPRDRFLPGLASFLAAHLLYIAAFQSGLEWRWGPLALLAFGAYAAVLAPLLWPHFGRMRGPALLYMLAILVMGWRAAVRWSELGDASAALALAGATLFVVSDSALAWNRFRAPFASAQVAVLGTYYPAQLLIALSVRGA